MKNPRLADSFHHALNGLRVAVAKERNFKIHIACAALAVAACIIFSVDTVHFALVAIAIGCVLAAELFNTAIEALTDLSCGGKPHPLAKAAKDTAAAAVLVAAAQAAIVGIIVAVSVIKRYL